MYRIIIIFIFVALNINATSIRDSVEQTLNSNSDIIAEKLKIEAYRKYINIEQSDYKPTLDLESFVEKSHTFNKPKNSPNNDAYKDGWNTALKFEHILYDGGLTPSELQAYTHLYNATKYESYYTIEDTVKDLVEAYIDLVSRQELMALSKDNIETHKKYLKLAREKEEISGEVLESYQVNSKYNFILDRFLEQENEKENALSLYKKLTTKDLEGNICRPSVNEKYIPKTLKEAIDIGVRRSYKVREQIEKIKEQREKLAQKQATFLPDIKLQLEGNWDYDIERPEDGRQYIYRSRVFLNWNFYEGDKNAHQVNQEKLFLKEEQKRLDAIVSEEVDKIKEAYKTYFKLKKRHEVKKLYVQDNKDILRVYKTQLEDGTRTFLDILNAESELYRSQISRIELEFDLVLGYYELLFNLSSLSDSILKEKNQVCPKYVFVKEIEKPSNKLLEGLEPELIKIFEDEGSVLSDEPSDFSLEDLEESLDTETIDENNNNDVDKKIQNLYLEGGLSFKSIKNKEDLNGTAS